jgi:hypothetical protein
MLHLRTIRYMPPADATEFPFTLAALRAVATTSQAGLSFRIVWMPTSIRSVSSAMAKRGVFLFY